MHFEELSRFIDDGIFDALPSGAYIHDLRERAEYIVSPIMSDETFEKFGLNRDAFDEYVKMFIERGLVDGKVIPYDGCFCIEDEESAVILENIGSQTLNLLTYRAVEGSASGLLVANMMFAGFIESGNAYFPPDPIGMAILEDRIELLPGWAKPAMNYDLVNATNTAIEQIAYMEKIGTWKEPEKKQEIPTLDAYLLPSFS